MLAFVYPSPFSEEGYVYVVAPGRDVDLRRLGALRPTNTWSPALWYDWVVLRDPEGKKKRRRPSWAANVIDAGFFAWDWSFHGDLMLKEPSEPLPAARPMCWEK